MYEYEGELAKFYNCYAPGLDGDLGFYVEEAKRAGGQVLELGCGTGRILIPTAIAGVGIVGLDLSPEMLAVAREHVSKLNEDVQTRIELLEGDMASFHLDRRFQLITIPYRAFLHMLTVDDQRNCLGCVREHLEENGRLILNVFDPRLDLIAAHIGPPGALENEREFTDPETERRMRTSFATGYTPETQRVDCLQLFELLDGDEEARTTLRLTLRWIYRYEMQHLLELCGFEVEALYGDFQRGPFKYGGEQIWVARKALKECETT
jgi:SAM-dependent methyltransferase